jgi:hypothetical protein
MVSEVCVNHAYEPKRFQSFHGTGNIWQQVGLSHFIDEGGVP